MNKFDRKFNKFLPK